MLFLFVATAYAAQHCEQAREHEDFTHHNFKFLEQWNLLLVFF
jgi:hypothetical protein